MEKEGKKMQVDGEFCRTSIAQERVYEAYNELHSLAQEFDTPFDAPAVLVVGHQTEGKSALVEALMGFQFNHVGGGTKTRRPITLHMKYDPDCELPHCRLVSDADPTHALDKTLEELQVRKKNNPSTTTAEVHLIPLHFVDMVEKTPFIVGLGFVRMYPCCVSIGYFGGRDD